MIFQLRNLPFLKGTCCFPHFLRLGNRIFFKAIDLMGSYPLQPGDAMQEKTTSNWLIQQVAIILFVRYTPGN